MNGVDENGHPKPVAQARLGRARRGRRGLPGGPRRPSNARWLAATLLGAVIGNLIWVLTLDAAADRPLAAALLAALVVVLLGMAVLAVRVAAADAPPRTWALIAAIAVVCALVGAAVQVLVP